MNFEDIVLSEIGQLQRDKYCRISLTGDTPNCQICIIEEENGSCKGLEGKGNGDFLIKEHKVSVEQSKF